VDGTAAENGVWENRDSSVRGLNGLGKEPKGKRVRRVEKKKHKDQGCFKQGYVVSGQSLALQPKSPSTTNIGKQGPWDPGRKGEIGPKKKNPKEGKGNAGWTLNFWPVEKEGFLLSQVVRK